MISHTPNIQPPSMSLVGCRLSFLRVIKAWCSAFICTHLDSYLYTTSAPMFIHTFWMKIYMSYFYFVAYNCTFCIAHDFSFEVTQGILLYAQPHRCLKRASTKVIIYIPESLETVQMYRCCMSAWRHCAKDYLSNWNITQSKTNLWSYLMDVLEILK